MPRERPSLALVVALWALSVGSSSFGQDASARPTEPWADPGLKVTRGLALWLDAGRLNAARKAHGRPEASDGTRVDLWYDASGHGRDFAQKQEESPPVYQDGALRFDGEASYLELVEAKARLTDFTLFVVAAPFSNPGDFRGFLAMHREGAVDFTSGVTVDMSFASTGRFESLNVEGNGFAGANNLMTTPSEFGVVRRMTVTSTSGPGGTKLYVDGQPGRSRDRGVSTLAVDRMTVGARYYGSPPGIRGFLDGDILQILVYDRVLDEAERRQVEDYLGRPTRRQRTDPPARPAGSRQAAGRRHGPAARADVRAGLLGAGTAGRPDEHQ